MTLQETLSYINENRGLFRDIPGTHRIARLLHQVGDPQDSLKFLHIAGTNGKGSTAAMLDAILRASGYRTGLFTSPHLVRFTERIRVDGQEIPTRDLIAITEELRPYIDAMTDDPMSVFEVVTAVALVYFARRRCDVVVLEVGMGGGYDATNVISVPELAILTNIGFDHMAVLGHTLAEIAAQKAGIIKPGGIVVCYPQQPEAMEVIRAACQEKDAKLYDADFTALHQLQNTLSGQVFALDGIQEPFTLPLLGAHQLRNAAVALTSVAVLQSRGWWIDESAVRQGLSSVQWAGRFELLHQKPPFVVDGGHNLQCAEAFAENVRLYFPAEKPIFLLGLLSDKETEKILTCLAPLAGGFVAVTPDTPRAIPAAALAVRLRALGLPVLTGQDMPSAVRKAQELAQGAPVCAFGSLYSVGAIRKCFGRE